MSGIQKNPIIERLERFIAATGMSNSQFADRAGIPRPTLSQIIHGRNKSINDGLLRKLDEKFPQLNLVWLLFGRGDMLTDANFEFSEASDMAKSDNCDTQAADNQAENYFDDLFGAVTNRADNERADTIVAPSDTLTRPTEATIGEKSLNNNGANVNPSDILSAAANPNAANDCGKTISSIMVFYTDNSFRTFFPADR